jgi:hypothetical protein
MSSHEHQRMRHRRHATGMLFLILLAVALTPARPAAVDNPIVVENQQPGSSSWMWSKLADDVHQQIKGYASLTSVNQNENITFYVSVNPAQNYTIDFYRFGYYQGLGARLRLHVGPLAGIQQPTCPTDATTGKIECNWSPGYVLSVPNDWTSGVYGAMLTNDQGYQNFVIFVVKDGRPAPFLYQQSVATDQAYNNYPNDGVTGKSIYGFNSYGANTVSGNTAAVKVSFDRPQFDSGLGNFYKWEMDFIRFIEKSGYDVTYSTDIDTHANGAELLNHRAFLSVGHDEYWTKEMRDAVEFARDSGVSLGFFGGNTSYTQIRLEPSSSGVENRVLVEYRDLPWAHTDPVQGPTVTGDYRWFRPEQPMVGVMYNFSSPNVDYVVANSSHWVYAGTGLHDGDHVSTIVGYEADSFLSNYPAPANTSYTLLSQSPYTDPGDGSRRREVGTDRRDCIRRIGDECDCVHRAHAAGDYGLHACQRNRGRKRHDHRHELHERDGGGVQRHRCVVLGGVRHRDPGDGACRRGERTAERHRAGRHGDQRGQFHRDASADDHRLHAAERGGRHQRDD